MTGRFEMKCSPEEYDEWTAVAHQRQQTLSAFVRDAARLAARPGATDAEQAYRLELHAETVISSALSMLGPEARERVLRPFAVRAGLVQEEAAE